MKKAVGYTMRLGLNKRGSFWLFIAIATAVVLSLAVVVECIPFASQVWDVVDGCSSSGGGGVLDCFREEISYSEICVASNTPSSILPSRTGSDLKSSCGHSTVARHVLSNLEYKLVVRALRSTIRKLSNSRTLKASFGRSETSNEGNYARTQPPTVAHNYNFNVNNHINGYRGGGTSHISAVMKTFLATLPAVSSRRISAMSDTAFETFSNQSDFVFGLLLSTSPAQSTDCPNPAAILSPIKGTQVSMDSERTDLSANIWKIASIFASLSQSITGTHIPFRTTHKFEQSPSKRRRNPSSSSENSISINTSAATTTTTQTQHQLTSPESIFDTLPSTQSPREQPRSGSTLYKYQQQTNFAHVPVASGRKDLHGSCLGLIVGLVACIMWF